MLASEINWPAEGLSLAQDPKNAGAAPPSHFPLQDCSRGSSPPDAVLYCTLITFSGNPSCDRLTSRPLCLQPSRPSGRNRMASSSKYSVWKGQPGGTPTVYFPRMGSINSLPPCSCQHCHVEPCGQETASVLWIPDDCDFSWRLMVPRLVPFLLLPIGRLIWKTVR